jgi:tetratricopeptide (TPR) repeat protein
MSRAIAAVGPQRALRWGAPVAAFLAVLAVLAVVNRSRSAPVEGGLGGPALDQGPPADDTQSLIAELQAAVRADPESASNYALLGDAYYQRARETGDASYYTRSQQSFDAALGRDPGEVTATVGEGTLALARHDFRSGLALGEQAHELEPDLVRPYAVIADAQVELGRYRAAGATINRLVRLKPTLAAYARVSYFRELNGDLDGAVQAMRFAVSAGSGSSEGQAYVQGLLGTLQLDRGHYAAATRAYREALAVDPSYPPALAGIARVEAGAGRFAPAIRDYRQVIERLPLPEYAIALGETEQAAGNAGAARQDFALVRAEIGLLHDNGVNTDVDLAIFEANHGDSGRAVVLGRRAWHEAPSVRSADAYSWALFADGRTGAASRYSARAMRLGSRDPAFLFHAGMIARGAGRDAEARRLLGRLVAQSPRFNPLYGPEAERVLERLR